MTVSVVDWIACWGSGLLWREWSCVAYLIVVAAMTLLVTILLTTILLVTNLLVTNLLVTTLLTTTLLITTLLRKSLWELGSRNSAEVADTDSVDLADHGDLVTVNIDNNIDQMARLS